MGDLAAYVIAKRQEPATPIHNISGNWINEDANTRGITKLSINDNKTVIRPYRACTPRDCDWGTVPLIRAGGLNQDYNAVYRQGFATRSVKVTKLGPDRIKVVVRTDFRDQNRPDYTTTHFLRKHTATR